MPRFRAPFQRCFVVEFVSRNATESQNSKCARVDVSHICIYIITDPATFSATPWGVGLSRTVG